MSATFACPHCGATYPRKPVLVGRAVRCTTCKNAFCLREDGIADPVGEVAPAPEQTEEPQQSAPPANTPPPAVEKPAAPAKPQLNTGWGLDLSVDVSEPQQQSDPAEESPAENKAATRKSSATLPSSSRRSERLTAQQADARRAMAATLSTSMTEALKSESVKREETNRLKKAKQGEGQVGKIGPAVLTGQGVEEAKNARNFILGFIGFILICVGLWWLIFTTSPEQAALDAFTAEIPTERIRAGQRIQAIQERAWLVGIPPAQVGVPPVIDFNDARIGSARTIKLAPAAPVFASLKNLVPVEPGPIWVPADRVDSLNQYRREDQTVKEFIALVLKREKKAISHQSILDDLKKTTGMDSDDAELIDLFIRGYTTSDGKNDIIERWMNGDVPKACQVIRFTGNNGLMLLSRGQSFKTNDVTYEGYMLRFDGENWPMEWKILTLKTSLKPRF